MEHVKSFEEFSNLDGAKANDLEEFIKNLLEKEELDRIKEINGEKETPKKDQPYSIKITIELPNFIFEHKIINDLQGTNRTYRYDPATTHPPVKAHYHIFDKKCNELYAVNLDGTAHHGKNKGYQVPQREAKALKELGVIFKNNYILEFVNLDNTNNQLIFDKSDDANVIVVFIIRIN